MERSARSATGILAHGFEPGKFSRAERGQERTVLQAFPAGHSAGAVPWTYARSPSQIDGKRRRVCDG
jgi:hypothetical protein